MDSGSKNIKRNPSRERFFDVFQTFRAYQTAVDEAAIVSIADLKGNIVYVNDRFVQISQYTREELVGRNHRIINSGFHEKEFFEGMWQTIQSGKPWRGEIKNKAKDGSYYWVDTVITPIFDRKGKIFQYLSIRNLINAQKENEDRLLTVQEQIAKREKQLIDAQSVAKIGSWYLDFKRKDRVEWSDEVYRIFEIPIGSALTYRKFLAAVHPEDRRRVDKSWRKSLHNGECHIEHRIITRSGEKWVSERAHFELDELSGLKNALGTIQDITERKKSENSLRESENLYKTLFNSSPFAIGIVSQDTFQFLETNETATALYGYTKDEFLHMTLYDIRVPEEHEKLTALLTSGHYAEDKTLRFHRKKNGDIICVEPIVASILYKGNQVYLIAIKDMTQKIKVEEQLYRAEQQRQQDIIEAEEKSRSQIGMELHDNVNQLLVAARLYLQNAHSSSGKSNDLISTSIDILGNAIQEIRELSAGLVTPILDDNNLKDSIEFLCKNYRAADRKVELLVNIDETTMQPGLIVNIYRIIQEQLTNIEKHANASVIRISLSQGPGFVDLEIADNGKGFDISKKKEGIGLSNIIRRAEAYGGKSTITTGINKGCRINIRFNIQLSSSANG